MEDFKSLMDRFVDFFVNNGFNILAAFLVLIIGIIVVKLLGKLFMKIIYSTKIDNAAGAFFVSIIKLLLWIAIFFIIASLLGIDGNSFLVAFSSIALAVGLALKDSLSNIANGIVIIINKPFKKGDFVCVDGVDGVIKNIKILTTELITVDNKRIVIPNSNVVKSALINYSSNPTRRLDFIFCVSYDSDLNLVKKVINESITSIDYVLKNPSPVIYLDSQGSSSLDYKVIFWVNTEDYWNCKYLVNEKVFEAFKAAGIEVPYNQMDLHVRSNDVSGSVNDEKN